MALLIVLLKEFAAFYIVIRKEKKKTFLETTGNRGTWVAQSVKPPTSAQVLISQLVNSRPVSGLCTEPGACCKFCVSLSLSTPPGPCSHSVFLSLSEVNKH